MQSACAILYCPLWPVQIYHIFPPYLRNGTIFEQKNVITHKVSVLSFSETFIETLPIKRVLNEI
jgi:hypothetical protein